MRATLTFLLLVASVGWSHQQTPRMIDIYTVNSSDADRRSCDSIVDVDVTSFLGVPSPNTLPCECILTTQPGDTIIELNLRQYTDAWRDVLQVPIPSHPRMFRSVITFSQNIFEGNAFDLPVSVQTSKFACRTRIHDFFYLSIQYIYIFL